MRSGFGILAIAAMLCFGSAAGAGPLVKLPADPAKAAGLRTTKAGSMDMLSAPVAIEAPGRTGVFGLNGRQYRISQPTQAEVVHVQAGQNTWVDKGGKAHPVTKGDVLFFAARRPNTARDAAGYVDHYVLFPATGEAADKTPDAMPLNPAEVDASRFAAAAGGREHVYLATDEGSRVVAWRADDQGSVSNSPDFRYLAVTAGRAVFTEGGASTEVAAGDTLLIPAGSSYSWRGQGLVGVLVSMKPKAN
ncbi:hypothetical protein [Phenylobacterium sp.]|jgi:uncharacterized cupin superfamily protein|uniref:hypothetical protein n=1 Tax=Phenylobacterium sp. TaxID=1871053 RepID=UPI003784768F